MLASGDTDFLINTVRNALKKETNDKLHVYGRDKAAYFKDCKTLLTEKQLKAFSVGGEGNGKASSGSANGNGALGILGG